MAVRPAQPKPRHDRISAAIDRCVPRHEPRQVTFAAIASQTTEEPDRSVVPYLPFETLRAFVARLGGGRPLPARIDRSLMAGIAGGTQTQLLGALVSLGLVGDQREVLPALVVLVNASDEDRPAAYAQLVRAYYREQLELSDRQGTGEQLVESFRGLSGYTGSTLRKAVTFFINMARYSDIPLSPYFKPPPQNAQPIRARARRIAAAPPAPVTVADPGAAGHQAAAETLTIELESGGTLTLSCSASFLSLSRADRQFVFGLVDNLADYGDSTVAQPAPGSDA